MVQSEWMMKIYEKEQIKVVYVLCSTGINYSGAAFYFMQMYFILKSAPYLRNNKVQKLENFNHESCSILG